MQELQLLRDQLDESQTRERKLQSQHEQVTRRLQTYLADRGDFHLLQDLSETLDIHASALSMADVLEHLVLQFGTLKADFSDAVYRAVFQNMVRWCQERWAHTSLGPRAGGGDVGGDVSISRNIAAIFGIIARSHDTRQVMLEFGVVEAMVNVLKSTQHAGTLEQAAACLSNLMLKSNQGREAVVSAGGLSVLVSLLHSSMHPVVQEKACSAMANLACSKLTKQVIATHKGILPLVEICRAGSCERTVENAARALRNLAHNSASNCSVIAGFGGLDVLSSLCEHTQHSGIAAQTSAAISNLATYDRNKIEIKVLLTCLHCLSPCFAASFPYRVAPDFSVLTSFAWQEKWGWSAKVSSCIFMLFFRMLRAQRRCKRTWGGDPAAISLTFCLSLT